MYIVSIGYVCQSQSLNSSHLPPFPFGIHTICFLLLLNCMSSFYVLDTNPLSDTWFTNTFSHSVDCYFTLLIISFIAQKLLSLMWSHLSIFAFVACVFVVISKKSLTNPMSWRFPLFSSRNFIVSGLMFRSLVHFELIFLCGACNWFFKLICLWDSSMLVQVVLAHALSLLTETPHNPSTPHKVVFPFFNLSLTEKVCSK